MKYFSFGVSYEPKVSGMKDASAQVTIVQKDLQMQRDYDKVRSFFMHLHYNIAERKKPPFDVEIESVRLATTAKLTDFLSFSPAMADCPFMMSFEASKLLSQFNLPEYYYYKVYKEKEWKWNLLHIIRFDVSYIDFSRSVFFRGHEMTEDLKLYTFSSLDDYNRFDEPGLQISIVALSEKFDKSLDLFKIAPGGLFISERLKNAMLDAGLTGMEFSEKPQLLI